MPRYIALITRSEDSGNESSPLALRAEMDQFVNDQLKSGVSRGQMPVRKRGEAR